MAESTAQERTEEPTARKLQKAREDGQVARSVELPAAAVTIAAMSFFFMGGAWLFDRLSAVFAAAFRFDNKIIKSPELLPAMFASTLVDALAVFVPVFVVTVVIAILAAGMTGGICSLARPSPPNSVSFH